MRSIGARLAVTYAAGATLSFAVLSLLGATLLETRLIRGLDDLNAAEFRQLRAHIGPDYASVDPLVLERRLGSVNQYQSILFYISIDAPGRNETIFRSSNLKGKTIPDIKGKRSFSVDSPDIGPLRVSEFLLPPYDVTVATSSRSVHEGMRAFEAIGGGLVAAMLILSIFVGRAFSRVLLTPLRAIRTTAERIGSDNLAERIPLGRAQDEVGELTELLNRMFDRIESAFAQMQRFSEEVSHELKTPLALIRLHSEAVAKADGRHSDAAFEQIEEIDRLNTFIDQMLFLSRAEANAIRFDLTAQDPAPFLESFAHDASALAEHSGNRFEMISAGHGRVAIERSWLRQVLFNLLGNAIRVSPPGALVTLTSTFQDGTWRLAIEDEGPGLSRDQCRQIFERFVRLGPARAGDRGAGLGLSIARSIVTLHHGTISAEPRNPRGLCVIVELPALDGESAEAMGELRPPGA
ncbi:MAG: cusS [Alphaproteobacteria bacterium]|nr:cusS [Alphaproteobacteria bacterium]